MTYTLGNSVASGPSLGRAWRQIATECCFGMRCDEGYSGDPTDGFADSLLSELQQEEQAHGLIQGERVDELCTFLKQLVHLKGLFTSIFENSLPVVSCAGDHDGRP